MSLNVYPTTFATVFFGVVLNLILPGEPGYLRQLKSADKINSGNKDSCIDWDNRIIERGTNHGVAVADFAFSVWCDDGISHRFLYYLETGSSRTKMVGHGK